MCSDIHDATYQAPPPRTLSVVAIDLEVAYYVEAARHRTNAGALER